MPAKNVGLKNGPRYNVLSRALWKKFVKETGNNIPFDTFSKVIAVSNAKIQSRVINGLSGFRMPEQMGHLVTTRYKPKSKRKIDWGKTTKHGFIVYHMNFQNNGFMPRILWLTDNFSKCKHINIYKFGAERKFTRAVFRKVAEGKEYNQCDYDQFRNRKINLNVDKLLR